LKSNQADSTSNSFVIDQLKTVPLPARKLFAMIVREAYHGPIHPKPKGIATPLEILEACGLDVGEFYSLLENLKAARLIRVLKEYPFEEIQVSVEAADAEVMAERCARENIPLEAAFVDLVALPGKQV